MGVLTDKEQELFDTAKKALPKLLFHESSNQQEVLAAFAKLMEVARANLKGWFLQTYIQTATGMFLSEHAKDRDTRRRLNETDDTLRQRLRNVQDAVTEDSLTAAANAILVANGLPETAAILELRQDRAFMELDVARIFCVNAAAIADGETFTVYDGTVTQVYEFDKNGALVNPAHVAVDISTAVSPEDVAAAIASMLFGFFTVAVYPFNASIVTLKSTVGFGITLSDTVAETDFRTETARKQAYLSRGYRMGRRVNDIIVILPFGTTDAIASAIREDVRQKKGAGTPVFVEVRGVP